jgi:hypothetical protein
MIGGGSEARTSGAALLPCADAEEEFAKSLKARLEAMPEFDPEGWALRLLE